MAERLGQAFERGTGEGLLQLGAGEVATPLPPTLGYWRDFSTRFVTTLCARPDTYVPPVTVAARAALRLTVAMGLDESIASGAPPLVGAEYLTPDVQRNLWTMTGEAVGAWLVASASSLQDTLRSFNPAGAHDV